MIVEISASALGFGLCALWWIMGEWWVLCFL